MTACIVTEYGSSETGIELCYISTMTNGIHTFKAAARLEAEKMAAKIMKMGGKFKMEINMFNPKMYNKTYIYTRWD